MKNLFRFVVVVFGVTVATLAPELADARDFGLRSFGFRGGVSVNPDQFHGGVFVDAGRILSNVRLQPSFELGIGNGVRLGTVNVDTLYLLAPRPWRPFIGGGLGLNFVDVTSGVGQGRGLETALAFNVVGGIEWGTPRQGSKASHRYLIEGRFGIGDTPDFKISAGIIF